MADIYAPKNAENYMCYNCDYKCSKKSDYDRHISTQKHHRLTNADKMLTKNAQKAPTHFECSCGNIYKHRQSLFKHRKICPEINKENMSKNEILNVIKTLIKDNQDFTKELINSVVTNQHDAIKEITKSGINTINNNTINNTNNNSNNKMFNIQFYLNETCKNAMNMTEFLDSIQLQLSDLTYFGENGYVKGISKIITDNLNKLDVTIRPINCTDKKRDSLYIKDDNKWEKDEEQKKIKQVIKKVAIKNEKMFPKYKETYPEYKNSESIHSDKYSKIVIESLDSSEENVDKIIKNVLKEVVVDKNI